MIQSIQQDTCEVDANTTVSQRHLRLLNDSTRGCLGPTPTDTEGKLSVHGKPRTHKNKQEMQDCSH